MLKRIGFIFLAMTLLLAVVGLSPQPAYAAQCTQWYTVQPGDNLYQIGLKFGVSWTYLAQINHLSNPNHIHSGQVLCVQVGSYPPPPPPPPSGHPYPPPPPSSTITPYFMIVSVVRDTSVTIKTYNFPANDNFNVMMNYYGTAGVNGIVVGSYASGNGASKVVSYAIPNQLKGQYKIAIRLQSPTSGYFAYNWFYNNTGGTSSGSGTGGGGVPAYPGYPYFFIHSVVRNSTVTIQAYNYPPNTKFDVLMGPYGTQGVNGYYVTSFNSGAGGTFTKTFPIPPELYGAQRIAIRTQSPVYYAYNWFWNNTATTP